VSNEMTRTLIYFLLIILPSFSYSQSVKKAYKLYEKGEIIKFRESLEKMDEKAIESTGKFYLYSLFYLIDNEIRDNVDSSFIFIKKSKEFYPRATDKEIEILQELNITRESLDSVVSVIDSLEYNFVLDENSIEEYTRYMRDHGPSKFYVSARENWHSIEFNNSSLINTWMSYKKFMESFPDSREYNKAMSRYEELIFLDKTADMRLSSYELFLENNPTTPYRDSVEYMILKYYSIINSSDNYKKFINKYPKSTHQRLAVNLLYHSLNRDISEISDLPIARGLIDSLEIISSKDKQEIIGVYEDKEVSFSGVDGKLLLRGISKNFDSKVFCSFSDSDFFVVKSGESSEILNRNLETFYSRDDVNLVEDIGMGVIKIFHGDGLDIIHKSGLKILSGVYDNVYLVDNKFLLVEANQKFSLFTFLGDPIFDYTFTDVFQEGPFLIFKNSVNKLCVVTSNKIEEKILGLDKVIDFPFDDYEYFDSEHILLFSEDTEQLLDSEMKNIISADKQIIDKFNFGWTSTTDFGVRVISEKLNFPFSTLFESIINSSSYFIGKRNDTWDAISLDRVSTVIENADSIYVVTDSALWYRQENKEALIFSNHKEIILKGDYSFKVLSPRYGSKSYIKIFSDDGDYILSPSGNKLPSAEYYYTVQSGNTFSLLSKKFNISQSEILRLNNKRNKKLYIGEKIKVRGYVPSDVISDSLFLIEYKGKKGIADIYGKIIIEPEYDGITNQSDNDIILIRDQMFGNFNIRTKKIITPKYRTILKPVGLKYYAALNEKFGLISGDGEVILTEGYDRISDWNDSTVLVSYDGVNGLVGLESKEIIYEFESYDFVGDDEDGIIEVKGEDGFGIYSKFYGELLKPVYNSIQKIELNNKNYFLAKRQIPEAKLLINLLVDVKGEVLINQALDLSDISLVDCDL